jgi:hypothetical protein
MTSEFFNMIRPTWYTSENEPNQCSFYWPPNQSDWKPPIEYYQALDTIAGELEKLIGQTEKINRYLDNKTGKPTIRLVFRREDENF